MMGLPEMEDDPYLQYQPGFATTLPIQILLTGITLTLLVILLIHLLFTTQYHYPLAPLNYCLQLASVLAVLLGVIVRTVIILQHLGHKADRWPYTLDYVSVDVPQPKWNQAEDIAWQTLLAISNGLANFLTLLYPSRTEARLIFIALGPLAVASSALYFCTLSSRPKVIDMGDAIRNVFSCTLLVIFSLSLFIWGFLVNRRRAWRLDGGTAVFGSGALGLAIVTTASSFVAVKEEGIDWLQHLIWAAVLWQTWLGWWWWVGAGMGIGEVEDIMERSLRKRRKAARRAHSRHVINNANEADEEPARPQTMAGAIKTRTSAVVGFTSSLAHLRTSAAGSAPGSAASAAPGEGSVGGGSLSRMRMRRRSQHSQSRRDVEEGILDDDEDDGEAIELGVVRLSEPARGSDSITENGSGSGASAVRHPQSSNSNSDTSSTSRTPSLHAPRSVAEFVAFPATWLQVYIRRLRKAHEEATRRRAVEQAERRARVPTMAASADDGWGLGSFGIREHQESTWRLQEADRQLRADRLIPEEGEREGRERERREDDSGEDGEGGPAPMRPRHSSARGSARTSRRNSLAQTRSVRERDRLRESQSHVPVHATTLPAQRPSPPAAAPAPGAGAREEDGEWEDILSSTDDDAPRARSHRSNRSHRSRGSAHTPPADLPPAGSSWSWWGPLREWRLRDRSTY